MSMWIVNDDDDDNKVQGKPGIDLDMATNVERSCSSIRGNCCMA